MSSEKNKKAIIAGIMGSATLVGSTTIAAIAMTNETEVKTGEKIIKKINIPIQNKDAKTNAEIQMMRLNHSDYKATGIFILKNSLINIETVNQKSSKFQIIIGQWGQYKNLNNGNTINPKTYYLNSKLTKHKIRSNIDGVLYIINKEEDNDINIKITVENGYNIPTFKINETKNDDFSNQLKQWNNSPFFEIIGKHIFGTFQMTLIDKVFSKHHYHDAKINELITYWDKFCKIEAAVHGLDTIHDGVAKKYSNLIHITIPDTGAKNSYASATRYRITFQQDTNAGKNLFTRNVNDQWGLWHEIGHTYQNPYYTFSNFGDITNNLYALRIQKAFNWKINSNLNKKKALQFIKSNDKNKSITKMLSNDRHFTLLIMLWQLELAYGSEFFPTLNQEYRLLRNEELPNNDEEKIEMFVKITSKITKRNLTPFFDRWGMKTNSKIRKELEQYTKLNKNIWDNITIYSEKDTIIDYILPKYNPVKGIKFKNDIKINSNEKITKTQVYNFILNPTHDTKIRYFSIPNYNVSDLRKEKIYSGYVVIDQNQKTSNKYNFNFKFK